MSAFIVIAGLVSLGSLPVALYPDILPPMVEVSTSYPGATPEVSAETVNAPLEQQINGAEGMIYQRSAAAADGTTQVVVTFAIGTDPDQAVINVQNRVQAALPLLPEEVRRQGVVVRKLNWTAVSYISIDAVDGRYDDTFISNYALVNIADELRRVPGVASIDAFGAKEHSIRIWLQPDKLAQFGLTPMDVATAVREQNSQFATGRIGDEPSPEYTDLSISITAKGRLVTPQEFERIILKAEAGGSIVRLGDVARVELAARDYSVTNTQGGKPAVTLGVFPQPGANVIDISNDVRETLQRLEQEFPEGMRWQIVFDTTDFVRVSIKEVLKTLAEAVILVFLVVFLFLQNWRATLIPCLAVPVSLIGALAGMLALGVTINLTTLFAMVLSIGIVVDDAIVVLENVERHMRTEGVSAREATRRAMREVTSPLIAIVLVLTAVFLPVAFLGGLAGEMYRQFAITLSVAVIISGFVALTLTPALCALLLKPHVEKPSGGMLARYGQWFERVTLRYAQGVAFFIRHSVLATTLFAIMLGVTWKLSDALPTSLVPEEDQGYIIAMPFLPPAASLKRTNAVMQQIEQNLADHPAVLETVSFGGFDPYTFVPRPGTGFSFITFKPWSERRDEALQSPALVNEVMAMDAEIKDALVFGAPPPPIEGLSATGGFEGFVQSRVGSDYQALEAATNKLVAAAAERPEVAGVFTSFSAQVPQLRLDIDREQAKLLGVDIDEIFATLQSTFGAYYVNDFNLLGRVYRVQMQSDAQYRTHAEDLRHVYVRSKNGRPIPITALGETYLVTGPDMVERFNIYPAARLLGGPAPGYSSGQALAVMEELAHEHLPAGYTLEWNAQAFLEKQIVQNTAGLYLLAMLMVFLILAAQYERLSLPFAVILSVPFAVFGAFVAVWARGLHNDLYLQIGLITLVGLAAKNAILIVEFAAARVKDGLGISEAAIEAARLRFRPILMTSLAFILGVLPLAISSGAGANARHSIGTGVIGGMLAATFLATLFTPLFFCWAERTGRWLKAAFNVSGQSRSEQESER
ncbi:MAG: multidrug efflux RND transporter permease subunit [Porticoccaceae bacterium]|nr:multidrug efflux RND transporter permease subunit [Porticoccaceae bacterium]